jgi:MoCo/4Fe-4S cofactor protein with predicted Tat translocation signal
MNGLHTTSQDAPRKEAESMQAQGPSPAAPEREPKLWRSLDELAKAPSFVEMLHREFPRQAAEWGNVDRRRFLQLTGASLALAGLTACDKQPPQKVVPYVRQPEDLVPGKPLFFATAAAHAGYGIGLLAESHMGRPTKVEGNPDHPSSLGASDIFTQASVLDLYDPDRAQGVSNLGAVATWEAFVRQALGLRAALLPIQGDGLRILTGNVTSPTQIRLLNQLLAEMPRAQWHIWEPLLGNGPAAVRTAFGGDAEVRYDLRRANVVLVVDADLLDSGPAGIANSKAFASRRKAHTLDAARTMSRLYSVETMPTGTSSVADHRLALKPSEVQSFLVALAARLGVGGASTPAGFESGMLAAWVEEVAADLQAHRGASVVKVGEYLDEAAQVLGYAINEALGNIGQTVIVTEPVAATSPSQRNTLVHLLEDIRAGRVSTLIFLGTNPLYGAPADLDFTSAIDRVPMRIHVGLHQDETAEYCQWHIAESHYLESWGDIRSVDGTATVVQPLVNPLYDTRPAISVIAAFLGLGAVPADQLVRETWQGSQGTSGAAFEKWWRRALHDGVIAGTVAAPRAAAVASGAAAAAIAALGSAPAASGLELIFRPDPTILDGRYANNGWLQECPKPITKLTWDNALMMSPRTARDNGLGEVLSGAEQLPWAPMVDLEVEGKSLAVAVWIVPGMADGALLLHLGYGRRRGGKALAEAGFDANKVRSSQSEWRARAATFRPNGEEYTLASTQDHHSMEGRAPVQMTNVPTWEHYPDSPLNIHLHVNPKLTLMPAEQVYNYEKVDRHGNKVYRWAMSIDLTSCTGCNACLVACVAENNIPAIGKDQVRRGREMHWIRIDRYFVGDDPNSVEEVVNQPVPCMQCEQAPCEVVCPVAATVHSDEGLNDMVYNRCVGTRYCSNNCPYKVRRFNFLLYQDFETESLKLGRNPDVSIRSRGVMEKCTYCVQRINQARIETKRERRRIKDGEVVTACQQACPCEAITFGDLNTEGAKVADVKKSPLDYTLLDELGNRPRTTYLGRVANPNPKLWQRLYPNRPLVAERHGAGHGDAGHGDAAGHGAQAAPQGDAGHGQPAAAPAGH